MDEQQLAMWGLHCTMDRGAVPRWMSRALSRSLQETFATSGALSAREIEVLNLLHKGCRNDEVGVLLGLSSHTVGTHVKNIYRKLDVHSRTEAVYEARCRGLISD